jgi:hypothetical protein
MFAPHSKHTYRPPRLVTGIVLISYTRNNTSCTSNRRTPISPILVTLVKEALGSSETSVLTRVTRRNIPEDAILHGLVVVENNFPRTGNRTPSVQSVTTIIYTEHKSCFVITVEDRTRASCYAISSCVLCCGLAECHRYSPAITPVLCCFTVTRSAETILAPTSSFPKTS